MERESRIIKAVALNLSYQQYVALCLTEGENAYSATSFYRKTKPLKKKIIGHYQDLIENRLKEASNSPIHIAFDTRWSAKGWKANESTTTVFYKKGEKYDLLLTTNLMKKGQDSNYKGTSKSMEVGGTEAAMKILKSRKIVVDSFVHDDDSSSALILQKWYPKAEEYLDIVHKCRSVRNRIYKLKDNMLKKKEWVGRIRRCASVLLYALRNDLPKKEEFLARKLRHWKGEHDNCENCNKQLKPLNLQQISSINLILQSIINDHSQLNHNFHTNTCESFHSLITRFCPKNTPQPNSYEFKIALAGISLIKSEVIEIYIATFLSCEILKNNKKECDKKLAKMKKRKEYIKKYQQSNKFKVKRKKKYQEKVKSDNSYGKETKCKCQKTHCISSRCSCYKKSNECSDNCGCAGCGNKFSNDESISFKSTKLTDDCSPFI